MLEELQKLGLSKYESEVYLALLKLGESNAKPILEETRLHRQIVYDALDKLIEKGFVSYILQAKTRYYKASSPKKFIETFDKQEEELEKKRTDFEQLLPKLEKLNTFSIENQNATIFKGNKGLRTLLADMIQNPQDELLTIGASDLKAQGFQAGLDLGLPRFHNLREKQKQHFKILLSEELKERARKLNEQKYTSAKILPKEFTSNMSTNIYGNKVSIILWGTQPFGILIESEEIANGQRKYFQMLWKNAKTIK